jgi:hypothetical protein
MRTRIDQLLVEQVGAFDLKYSCEHCGHFDHTASCCSLGYPEEPHRWRALEPNRTMVFCKEFDLV